MTASARRRLLLVGLDGGTFDVLDPLIAAGRMPFLSELADAGVTARLVSTVPPVTPVAWTTFMTGVGPGRHGVLDFRAFDPSRGLDEFVSALDIRMPTLWERLSKAGFRVGVFNLPMTWPCPGVDGFVVSGFDTPPGTGFTHPPELEAELIRRFPNYRPLPRWGPRPKGSRRGVRRLARQAERVFQERTEAALWLAEEQRPDVLMVQFQALDLLQHRVWGYLRDDPRCQRDAVEAVHRAMEELDRCVRRLCRHPMFAEADVAVISDHGFGPLHGTLYPNVLLEREGFLARTSPASPSRREPSGWLPGFDRLRRLGARARWRVRQGLDRREWIERLRDEATPRLWDQVQREGARAIVGMGELSAYVWCLPAENESAADVREAVGRVLTAARLPDGAPAFAEIRSAQDAFGATTDMPDLIAITAPGWKASRDLADEWMVPTDEAFGGTHRPEGILIAGGPGFAAVGERATLGLVDMAPTLLHLLGQPVPSSLEGVARVELLATERSVQVTEDAEHVPGAREHGEDVRERMENVLRGLGYLR